MTRVLTRAAGSSALVAVLLAGLLMIVPPASAAGSSPSPPARAGLTAELAGDVTVELDGSLATITVDAERVHPVVYAGDAEPVSVGWVDVVDGAARIDLALMPAGDVTIAVLGADGELIGWASAELAADDSHAPPAAETTPRRATPWPAVAAVAGAVLLAVVVLVLLRRRPSRPAPAAEEAEEDGPIASDESAAEPGDEGPAA